ncbi:putative RNA binding protein [Spironucleus salmonicida]|uniref:RNA binding protein n=1 Tax=Spironucleus salmonicida TaxID=348837 RepID=V6LJ84_9EUKA|nr:putative RNA binding protein [Spironucleus salmonicida]|eukprot:EST44413.1 RNA recognition motif-containing protein [Spironucleus salmonicida]
MKLPITRTIKITNYPDTIERPELFAAISQILRPDRLYYTPKSSIAVFQLESEKIDFLEQIKTSPIELFEHTLKITDYELAAQKPTIASQKLIIPLSFKDSKIPENQHQKMLQRACKTIDNVKVGPSKGYNLAKDLLKSSTYEMVVQLQKTATATEALKQTQTMHKFARIYGTKDTQIIIRNIGMTTTFSQFMSIFRSTFHFPTRKVVFSGKKWAIVTLFDRLDSETCVKLAKIKINDDTCIIDFLGENETNIENQEELEHIEEDHSFEIVEDEEEEEDNQAAKSESEDSESDVKIQVYDPTKPLEDQLKELSNQQTSEAHSEAVKTTTRPQPQLSKSIQETTLPKQLFISNLPIYLPNSLTKQHTVKQTLRRLIFKYFSPFGVIASVIVTEKSGNLNGTAFLTFEDADSVEKTLDLIRYIQQFKSQDTLKTGVELGKNTNFGQQIKQYCKENEIKQVPWEFLDLNQGSFIINSQIFYVSRALSKNSLDKKLQNENIRNEDLYKFQAKNTGSGEENNVPPQDLVKRNLLFKELKLKSQNINFHFSPTRIVVKNLPKDMDEHAFWLSIYRFYASRKLIVPDDTFTISEMQKLMDFKTRKLENKAFYFMIQQLKISEIRLPREDTNTFDMARCKRFDLLKRMDELSELGYFEKATKQVVFLEFEDSNAACAFFKLIDNNSQIFGRNKRPILSFAVRDVGREKGRDGKGEKRTKEDEK